MTLLRAAARTMLASYFVVSGLKALRDPGELVPAAEPLVDKVVPLVRQYAPQQVAEKIPEDTATLVRINGALQLAGGLALASGKGRRLGAALLAASLVPSTIAKHPFWQRDSAVERAADRQHFLKNVSLLGGVLLAARDTEGQPGLAWRAHKTQQAIARDSRRATKAITRSGHDLGDQTKDLAESALAGGSALIGTVVASTRKARKQAAKQLKRNGKIAQKQFVEAQKAAAAAAKKAKKEAPKLARQAQKSAAAAAKQAKKEAPKLARQAQKNAAAAAKQAKKDAPKLARQAERARRDASKAAREAWQDRGKAIKQARKDGGAFLEQAAKDGGKFADQVKKDAGKIADNVADSAKHAVDAAKKTGSDLARNIHLGDN